MQSSEKDGSWESYAEYDEDETFRANWSLVACRVKSSPDGGPAEVTAPSIIRAVKPTVPALLHTFPDL